MTKHIWYHQNCSDGFGAAYAAWLKFGTHAVAYDAVQYQQTDWPWPDHEGDELYIVDFCPPMDVLEMARSKFKRVVVIDHHASSRRALLDAYDCSFNDEALWVTMFDEEGDERPSFEVIHDTRNAACMLAWRYFCGTDSSVPMLLRYIEDRDLWRWALPDSHDINYVVGSTRREFIEYDILCNTPIRDIAKHGAFIRRYVNNMVDEAARHARLGYKHKVPFAIAAPKVRSEVGSLLLHRYPEAPYVMILLPLSEGGAIASLRSTDYREDVSLVAEHEGGGGHRNAASFRMTADEYHALVTSSEAMA